MEITTNTYTVYDALVPRVHSVTVVHPPHLALITRVPVKTDNRAALVLAQSWPRHVASAVDPAASCARTAGHRRCGVAHGACIDGKFISEITGRRLDGKKDKGQRPACGCITSTDIGAYNTCPHGCIYCYANSNANTVRENYAIHNPRSPLIYGEVGPKDRITEREMK